jgi:nickel-dependent lactate racemase
MEYFAEGSLAAELSEAHGFELADELIDRLACAGPMKRVLLLPPDYTRLHSGAGPLTCRLYEQLVKRGAEIVVMPATGTHFEISSHERESMFPGIPANVFRHHDWRNGVVTVGEIPASEMLELSEGKINLPVSVQVDRLLFEPKWDAIISVGQLVPHEVIGIANQVKNVLVGTGGFDIINKSHWLGAVHGMEQIMGRDWSPVRELLTRAATRFLSHLPITYLLTVRQRTSDGRLVTRGIFAGDDKICYLRGAALCRSANLDILDHAPKKIVVYLDPEEFKSTWVGNKAIYRTRMAVADDGELIILAPGVKQFGEDPQIDSLIRRFGYRGTPATLEAVANYPELASNLSAAAHLIHGSTEGRFRVTYCPGHLTREEVEGAGFGYADLGKMLNKYPSGSLSDGWNRVEGEEVFYVSNPALGLWGTADRFRH